MCQVRAITGCGSPSRVPFEFTTGWGELSIGGCPTWGRTVVCDVVVPVREFAPKCVEQMLEDQPRAHALGHAREDPVAEELARLRFGAVAYRNDLNSGAGKPPRPGFAAPSLRTLQCCITFSCLSQVW